MRADDTEQRIRRRLLMARVTSAHGIQGHMKVHAYTQSPSDLSLYSPFYDEDDRPLFPRFIRSLGSQTALISLPSVHTRSAAEEWRGRHFYIHYSQLPPLEEDTFYHEDLIGLRVQDEGGEAVGIVREVVNHGAGDILEIMTPEGRELSLSFLKSSVPYISLLEGYMVVCRAFLLDDSSSSISDMT